MPNKKNKSNNLFVSTTGRKLNKNYTKKIDQKRSKQISKTPKQNHQKKLKQKKIFNQDNLNRKLFNYIRSK